MSGAFYLVALILFLIGGGLGVYGLSKEIRSTEFLSAMWGAILAGWLFWFIGLFIDLAS